MISIVTVNWNSPDWLSLMLESLERFTDFPYNVVVIDNSNDPSPVSRSSGVRQVFTRRNLGHGLGLNMGVQIEKAAFGNKFVMFLDVDCHALVQDWDIPFLEQMEKYDIVAGRGVPVKPIRPACMFMKSEIAQKYDWKDTPGYKGHRVTPEGFDVAIPAYHLMREDNVSLGLLEAQKNHYGTLNGEEWCVDGNPLIYHHWHGSHLVERQVDFPEDDLIADKKLLFSKIPWRVL